MEPISNINSSKNQLFFRGINAVDLAREFDYETVLYLLLYGILPFQAQYNELVEKLIHYREFHTNDMISFKAVASRLTNIQEDNSLDIQDTLLAFVSLSAITAAEIFAQSKGLTVSSPRNNLNLVPNFLWQTMQDKMLDRDIAQFQNCLILHMDDPDNPSLTALSQVLQQGGTISQALVAALEKHVDVLHHGAGTETMRMFIEVRNAESKSEYLQQRILKGNKIFGLGHRIYTGLDPRAAVLKDILEQRALKSENKWLIEITDEVEALGSKLLLDTKGIDVYPNVDFYNAATYTTFGFPYEFNTTLFALARVAGWSAHILEIKKK